MPNAYPIPCREFCTRTYIMTEQPQVPFFKALEISLDRYEENTALCSEKQDSVAAYQCPGLDLIHFNLEQRKARCRHNRSLTGRTVCSSLCNGLQCRGMQQQQDECPCILYGRLYRYEPEPYLQLVHHLHFQGHECFWQLKDVLVVLSSHRLSSVVTAGMMDLIQPLNTEIHKLLIVGVQHSIAI